MLSSLVVGALGTCVKESVLSKDALLPLPSNYQANWEACQKSCAESMLCDSFTFKSDTVPAGGCWLFPKTASLNDVPDAKAVSGPKACAAAAETPAAAATAKATEHKVPGLRGYGIPAAASHSYGIANAGHQVSADVFTEGTAGKALMAEDSGHSSVTNLAIGGGVGAVLVAAGAFMMIPAAKKKKSKRGLQREQLQGEAAEAAEAAAPAMSSPLMAPEAGYAIQPQQEIYMPQMYLQPVPVPLSQYGQYPQYGQYVPYGQYGQYHQVEPVTQMSQMSVSAPVASYDQPAMTYQQVSQQPE